MKSVNYSHLIWYQIIRFFWTNLWQFAEGISSNVGEDGVRKILDENSDEYFRIVTELLGTFRPPPILVRSISSIILSGRGSYLKPSLVTFISMDVIISPDISITLFVSRLSPSNHPSVIVDRRCIMMKSILRLFLTSI